MLYLPCEDIGEYMSFCKKKKIEKIYVLKSATFFDIDCDFRFQQEYLFHFITLLLSPVK